MRASEIGRPLPQLDELNLRQYAIAGAVGLGIGSMVPTGHGSVPQLRTTPASMETGAPSKNPQQHRLDAHKQAIADSIARRYRIDRRLATEIVYLSYKYERQTFPRAQDILAVIGIESSFDPNKVSKLKRDPAIGLMQVRPMAWGIEPRDMGDMESQVAKGSEILHSYYVTLKSPTAALNAYNIGITSHLQGHKNPRYVKKFARERGRMTQVASSND